MQAVEHRFAPSDLVGGHLALDFVNTATARDAEPSDWLGSYDALLDWAALTRAYATGDLAALRKQAQAAPRRAADALSRARAAREALYESFAALAHRRSPPAAALLRVEADWKAAARTATLAAGRSGAQPRWLVAESGLDLIRDVAVWRAAELLAGGSLERLKQCGGDHCAWLFLDTSKNARRRWCDMATCGNVAKARRHYRRHRDG